MADTLKAAPETALVYLDGRLVAGREAALPLDDRGLLYGLGFFETFRTSGARPHHWRYHAERLARSGAVAGMAPSPESLAGDESRLREIVRRMLQASALEDAVFRYTITAGATTPREFLTLRPLPVPAPAAGVALRVLNLRRDSGEWLPRPKSLNYANAYLGARELQQRSTDASDEGLFLTRAERCLVETPRQNLAWIERGQLCFPDPDLGAVPGTCLQWVRERVAAARPRRAPLETLLEADAIFVLNAVRGVTPVRGLWDEQDRPLAGFASHEHPLVARLRREWNEALDSTARS